MHLIKGLLAAFATFSRIPVPGINYSDDDMRYQLCFIPAVGAVIGLAVWLADKMLCRAGAGVGLRAACLTAVPVLLSGGIHMDGYCDTVDALSSYKPKEKKLEILRDSNVGAFAVIHAVVWFILYYGAMTQIHEYIGIFSLTFILSRAFAAVCVALFKSARSDGMGAGQKKVLRRGEIIASSFIFIAGCTAAMIYMQPLCAIAVLAAALLVLLWYRCRVCREFGGFTGDTSGWLIQSSELVFALVIAVFECIVK